MIELQNVPLTRHIRALQAQEYTSEELTLACLARIRQSNGEINSFVFLDEEGALAAARASDERRRAGCSLGRLDGIPFAVKDNFCVEGMPTTCASNTLKDYIAPYHATAVYRLKEAGAVLLGKLNMDELAMGSMGTHSIFGPTANPRDTGRVSGGSSGGSAAAVAGWQVPFALGSDTGGSVRQPAAFCGVTGFKPTYGAISRYGLVAFASSLDTVGIVAATAADCREVYLVLAGKDELDATSLSPRGRSSRTTGGALRVAVVRELLERDTVSKEVKQATLRTVEILQDRGAEIGYVNLPAPQRALASYCVLSAVEASSNLARYDGIRYGTRSKEGEDLFSLYANSRAESFGSEVKRRVLFGTCILTGERRSRYLPAALRVRQEICTAMCDIFSEYDLILGPTAPTAAFSKGDVMTPARRREADLCAVYANLAGLPAISIPVRSAESEILLGVQLTASRMEESRLLDAAELLQEALR